MVSAFYPVAPKEHCEYSSLQYAPPATAEVIDATLIRYGFPNTTSSIKTLDLPVCSTGLVSLEETFPIILHSHGLLLSRLLSSSEAQSIASSGYIVLTIDHTYDSPIVEFSDGTIVRNTTFATNEALDLDVQTRSKDASFLIDQFKNSTSPLSCLPASRTDCGDVRAVAMYGHSLGGTSSARAAYDDPRLLGAVNLDGYPYGFNTTGTPRAPVFTLPEMNFPFLLFNANVSRELEPYIQFVETFTGFAKQLGLNEAGHVTSTDVPLLVKVLGVGDQLSEAGNRLIGTLDGLRAREVVVEYIVAFMDRFLKDGDGSLLDGPSEEFLEVQFAR